MHLRSILPVAVILILFTFGFAQQLGGDNISYTGDGVTIFDFSRAVPAALACAAVVIVQALNISYFLISFSKDPPKEKPKEEKKPYGQEKPKEEKPKEEKPKEEKNVYGKEEEKKPKEEKPTEKPTEKPAAEKPQQERPFYGKPPAHYFRYRRSPEENNLLEMLKSTEHEECYSRLICTMATGNMISSKFDVIPKFFLDSESTFRVDDFGYKYAKAAVLGKSGQSVEECETRYQCPLTQNEFAKMILN